MEKYKIIGWDIGGANIKATKIIYDQENQKLESIKSISKFFPMWDQRQNPKVILEEIYQNLAGADYFAVTMTAELADRFSTKIEGVNFIVDLFKNNFPNKKTFFYNNQAQLFNFIQLDNKSDRMLELAAANWAVSAAFTSEFKADFILFDLGSSTIDLIPVKNHQIAAHGRTDIERLKEGELIYLGLLRSNLSNLVESIPHQGKMVAVINEYFASTADLHLLLNIITTADYSVSPADNGNISKKAAAARIARMISLDLNSISVAQLKLIVDYIYNQEISLIYSKLLQLYSRVSPDYKIPLLMNREASLFENDLKKISSFKFIKLNDLIPIIEDNILTTTAAAFLLLKKLANLDLTKIKELFDD